MVEVSHTVRIGGTSTVCIAFFAWIEALIRAAASAARAAASALAPDSAGLEVFASGLRLRALSAFLVGGERERRSKREARLCSGGSVWSKRERLRGSSDMVLTVQMVDETLVRGN